MLSSYFPSSFLLFLTCLFYPALTGSKTLTSKFSESKEARCGSTAPKSPIGEG
ncbi:spermidine/putrescine ABC transporter ATP-binding protein [Bacillus anthracis]|nr:spermidine/putrescine ABC transporter ATP-binding protein [Bacillus cereus]PGQ83206.1 spermidine/putrescine ABC transporter ATP-binding protein [Bacillus anthracis]PGX51969.1 spermidine/putrescine ABC transporter ATP-binding protein [Bacillus anthracis]